MDSVGERNSHDHGIAIIPPRSGVAFRLARGQHLRVIDPQGYQVADLAAFNASDTKEFLSNGRTFDYAGRVLLTTQDTLYSNRSNPLLRIVADTVGRHDFLVTPCSKDTFRFHLGHTHPHRGCFGNLVDALGPFGIPEEHVTTPFNCFMNVQMDGSTGHIQVRAPLSRAGDYIEFVAMMDVVVGLTACSAERSNDGTFKPIHFIVNGPVDGENAVQSQMRSVEE